MRVKESEVFVVVSSLTRDMTSSADRLRAQSMKVLAKVVQSENLPAIERYLRQSIMDKSVYIQRSALAAGIILWAKAPEYVRKWAAEIQEKLQSKDPQTLFLALVLASMSKASDALSLSRASPRLSPP